MKSFLKKLFRSDSGHHPLITINISRSAIEHNLREFKKLMPNVRIAPVLKSNAYGHGLKEVAEILKNEQAPFFVVDSFFEARTLRNEGYKFPLLILGYSSTEVILENTLKDVRFAITGLDALKELAQASTSKTISIHLKVDTGMHRQGISLDEVDEACTVIGTSRHIFLEGICSHFADADNRDPAFTSKQILLWDDVVKKVMEYFPQLPYYHISATAGHIYDKAKANVSRLGIGLYGVYYGVWAENLLSLKPALEMKSILSGVKKIKTGDCVGYACTFVAPNDMTIATVPVGYYEGVNRRLSNNGFLKIGTQEVPIIGRVSMNITTVDISSLPYAKRGDEVVIISNVPKDQNSMENMARLCGNIPYEVSVYIPAHLKRVIVD